MTTTDAAIADISEIASDHIRSVLALDNLDEHSRDTLAYAARLLSQASALLTPQPPVPGQRLTHCDWTATWYHHVGAMFRPGHHASRTLKSHQLAWADEIDAMADRDLLALRGFGPKGLACTRAALDVYYWRSNIGDSRDLWASNIGILTRALGYFDWQERDGLGSYEAERERVNLGLEFARRVVNEDGAPLADPTTVRMIP